MSKYSDLSAGFAGDGGGREPLRSKRLSSVPFLGASLALPVMTGQGESVAAFLW